MLNGGKNDKAVNAKYADGLDSYYDRGYHNMNGSGRSERVRRLGKQNGFIYPESFPGYLF